MKFTIDSVLAPALKYSTVGLLAVQCLACSSSPQPTAVAPSDPTEAIHKFMAAVKANDLPAMGALWGTESGPATSRMTHEEAEQRLTIMRLYLEHERYSVLGTQTQLLGSRDNQRMFRVQLERKNCKPVVPFVLVRAGASWMVESIDLAEAGNPQRSCPAKG